jgi:hypothetical protein
MLKPTHYPHSGRPSLFALAPFITFIGIYVLLIIIFPQASNTLKLAAFPVFAGIASVGFSLFTFQERIPISKKIKIFITGVARPTVIYMCFIFIFSSIFSHVISLCGGVDSAIKLCYVIYCSLLFNHRFINWRNRNFYTNRGRPGSKARRQPRINGRHRC